jgi:deazaflavin-dependent oxidoreductase (nitroreductase family)
VSHTCFMSLEKTATRDVVRVFNKHVLNPVMLRLAGSKHFYASAIEHTGRRSGKHYVTPVVATRVADGFVVPLPYGTHTDWLLNLEAGSNGRLRFHGSTFPVTAPTVVDAATAAAELPASRRRAYRRLGFRQFVHLNPASQQDEPTSTVTP